MTLPSSNVTDLLLDAICVVDRQGRFLSITGACVGIFGYRPEEMLGRPMIDFVYHEDRARTLGAVERIEAGYLQRHFENRYVRKDGSIVYIMWSARMSESGEERIAVARDVTWRHRALPDESIVPSEPPSAACWRLSGAPPTLTPPGFARISLSAQDYTVLHALASGGDCITRKSIVAALGERYLDYDQRRLDTQMRRLRRKVEQACGLQLPVATVRGVGFRVYAPFEIG